MSKYSVRNVKTFRGMDCPGFNCSLYKDGKRVGEVDNDGSGGETCFWFKDRNEKNEFEAYVKSLPPVHYPPTAASSDDGLTLEMSGDLYVDQLLEEHDLAKKCRKKTLFRKPGEEGWYYLNRPFGPEEKAWLVAKYGKDVEILNERLTA